MECPISDGAEVTGDGGSKSRDHGGPGRRRTASNEPLNSCPHREEDEEPDVTGLIVVLRVDDDSHTERCLRPGHLEGPDLNVSLPGEFLVDEALRSGRGQRNQTDQGMNSTSGSHAPRMGVTRQPRVLRASGLRQRFADQSAADFNRHADLSPTFSLAP